MLLAELAHEKNYMGEEYQEIDSVVRGFHIDKEVGDCSHASDNCVPLLQFSNRTKY